ncbi:MAG: hypothetical protein HY465_01100 [Deltaproteobacteria bacterium]|nr:hypothetical protein [Deltaproteobacteria bacterium]
MTRLRATETAEFFDLDGTCNHLDIQAILDGHQGSPEVTVYLAAAADFLLREIPQLPHTSEELLNLFKEQLRNDVFPKRSQHQWWATFPSVQREMVPICPAVDHYLLTPHAIRRVLEKEVQRAAVSTTLQWTITTFLSSGHWEYSLFKFCSEASLPHATIEEDAIAIFENRLCKNALVSIFTNSATQKARTMAEKAGFGSYLIEDHFERGKLAIIGDGKKFMVDREWPQECKPKEMRFGDTVDLSRYFGEKDAIVDLRRRPFYERIKTLMHECGAKRSWMVSDIATLDLFPFANWLEFEPRVAMRTNPTSSPEEVLAARELLNATIGKNLPEITMDLE